MASSSAAQDGLADTLSPISNSASRSSSNRSISSGSSSGGDVPSVPSVPLLEPEVDKKEGFAYTAGPALISGASQAILFNPIDRALYVRVQFRRRRFLDKRNFERPFQGFMNAAVYRTLVGASYMFWQDSMRIAIERLAPAQCQASASPQLNSVMIGLSAGSVNGFALNMLQAVKFRMWNTNERGVTFIRTALNMYKEGGLAIFFRGCITTMVRDSVFGVVYETTRRAAAWRLFFEHHVTLLYTLLGSMLPPPTPALAGERGSDMKSSSTEEMAATAAGSPHDAARPVLHKEKFGLAAFLSNLMAALIASMMSSPFNYVRSIVYGTPAGAIPLGYMPLLKSFYTQFYYIYRNGRSYTDRHGMPELSETEHRSSPQAAPSATSNGAGGVSPSTAKSVPQQLRRAKLSAKRMSTGVRNWADKHQHHPIAAWTWANSRLNIGWGSVRVGLGMAMGQSLFYLAQDVARVDKRKA